LLKKIIYRHGEERERYLNRIGWREGVEEMMEWSRDEEEYEIINKEKGIQRNAEEVRIRQAKYNR